MPDLNTPPIQTRSETPVVTRELNYQALSLRVQTVNEENRSVEATLSTEGMVEVFDYRSFEVIDEILISSGMEMVDRITFLADHNRFSTDKIRGSIREFRVEDNQVVCRLFFATDLDSENDWKKVKDGHITDVSAGYRALEFVEIPPGESHVVNGKTYTAGTRTLRVTTKWRAHEGSLTAIGADPDAKIREQHHLTNTTNQERTMPEALRKYLEKNGLRADATDAQAWEHYHKQQGETRSQADGLLNGVTPPAQTVTQSAPEPVTAQRSAPVAPTAAPTPATALLDQDALRAEGVQLEQTRQAELREMAGTDVPAEIVQRAISENWTTERASREFLDSIRSARNPAVGGEVNGQFAVHSRSHTDLNLRALECAMLQRSGVNPVDGYVRYEHGSYVPRMENQSNNDELQRAAEIGYGYRDMSLVDLCREAIRLDGGNSIPNNRTELIQRAMSGGALTDIFTSNFAAQLISGYESLGDTTPGWTRDADVPNFQTNERAMMGKSGGLKKHGRGGKANHMDQSDSKEEYKIARYTGKYTVDEMDIIDDRFGAIEQMTPEEMGEAAAMLRPELVYAILLKNAALGADSVALFHANHNNVQTGAALASATLKQAINDLNTQMQNGRVLNKNGPLYLITPENLSFTADQLVSSAEIREAAAENGTINSIRSRSITAIADARLDNGVTDPVDEISYAGSGTTWFLARGNSRHTIEVGYLRGSGRAPTLRNYLLTEGEWGIGWDIKFDIGAKALDFRGLHKNTA